MTKDNSTGKDKEFYELGKKMFDRLNPITSKLTPPDYVPMFTVGQLNQYGQASFEEGVASGSGPCQTCEALARTVMLDQTSHDVQRPWVGLTEDEILDLGNEHSDALAYIGPDSWVDFAAAIEAKLKEKNT